MINEEGWNDRLYSREHLGLEDRLAQGDCYWSYGEWIDIAPTWVGMLVSNIGYVFGQVPTVGRLKKGQQ